VIYAGRTYESGEQLFFEYGQHRNEDLLYQYGFVLEDNLYSKIDLKFDWPTIMSGDPATAEKKLEYLQTLGLPGEYVFKQLNYRLLFNTKYFTIL